MVEKPIENKQVLLRERKRHTARHVVSTPSVVLPGYPPPPPRGGVPDPGTPSQGGVPDPGTPPRGGYLTRVPPPPRGGYRTRVPPPGGYPDPPPPPPVWTDKQSETITFPSSYVRGR